MPKYIFIFFLMLCVIAGPVQAAEELTYSGFLGDYSRMKSYPHAPGVSTATSPAKELRQYKKVMLSSVELKFAPDSGPLPITDWQLKELEEFLRQKTRQLLSAQFDVVREPAEDVLVFRLGITDITPNEVITQTEWDPKNPDMEIGHATVEADFVVSTTGERVFAMIDERASLRYQDILGSYSWWKTDDIYSRWRETFSQIVDEQYGRY